jgi:hypothetical protein
MVPVEKLSRIALGLVSDGADCDNKTTTFSMKGSGKNTMKTISKIIALFGLLGLASIASANPIVFTLENEVSGSGGVLTGAIVVTLDDATGDPNTVAITIDMTALSGGESLLGLYLNFDPAKNPAGMTITDTGAVSSLGIIAGANCCKPDGQDDHDVQIDFDGSGGGEFTSGEIYTGILTLAGGLTSADFNFLSNGDQGTENCAVARVNRVGPDNQNSGWFDCTDEPPQEIAEPGSLALFGLGLSLLGLFGRRRRVNT